MSHLGDIFKSKEEKEERSKAYSLKLFPFGDAHISLVKDQLARVFTKAPQEVIYFNYIVSKEKMIKNNDDTAYDKVIKQIRKIRPRLSKDEVNLMYRILECDVQASSVSDLEQALKTFKK